MKKILPLLLGLIFLSCGQSPEKKEFNEYNLRVITRFMNTSVKVSELQQNMENNNLTPNEMINEFTKIRDELNMLDEYLKQTENPRSQDLQYLHAALKSFIASLLASNIYKIKVMKLYGNHNDSKEVYDEIIKKTTQLNKKIEDDYYKVQGLLNKYNIKFDYVF